MSKFLQKYPKVFPLNSSKFNSLSSTNFVICCSYNSKHFSPYFLIINGLHHLLFGKQNLSNSPSLLLTFKGQDLPT